MRVGIVVIARNEGQRLVRCLESVRDAGRPVVYVDSGSTDGSVAYARSVGVEVVELDMSVPFTAARARNAGRRRLAEIAPDLDAVQMLDGDCVLNGAWLDRASAALAGDGTLAVVWGRMRERHPEASVYNRLCDLEWDTPSGETTWFGGNALIRTAAFDQVGGYDPSVIAGEEPDLAWRLRARGWRIERLDAEVALHDADITRFGQWWKRATRAGYAHVRMAAAYGWRVQPYNPCGVVTTLGWSLGVPTVSALFACLVSPWSLLALLVYPAQWWRISRGARRAGRSPADARLVATFTLIGKWAETLGYWRWAWRRLTRRHATLIEYKSADPHPDAGAARP